MAGLIHRSLSDSTLGDGLSEGGCGEGTQTCQGGVAAGTHIMTLDGALPVEFLEPGDRIITRSGARVLCAVSVRVSADESVLRVSAGALGFDRPEGDVLIGSDQAVLVRDWRARAMFGQAQATVPVSALADGTYIASHQVSGLRFYTLSFDAPEVIYAEGVEIATTPVSAIA